MFEMRKRSIASATPSCWISTEYGTTLKVEPMDAGAEMRKRNLWVAAFPSEDLQYLAKYFGADRMLMATDYCHNDAGTDPLAHFITMTRDDLDPVTARQICDDNARAAYDIPRDFTPTGPIRTPEMLAI